MRKPHYFRNLFIFALVASLIGAVVIVVLLVHFQVNAMIGPRTSQPGETPADYGLSFQDLTLFAPDGTDLAAWYVQADEPNGAALVLVHGFGANRAALLPTAVILAEHGYCSLLLDLRGHGESGGELVTYGYYESSDVLAAVDYLLGRPEIGQDGIGLLGRSFGGAAVSRAAARSPVPKVLILESTFSSLPEAIEDAFDDYSSLPKQPFSDMVVWLAERRVGLRISEVNLVNDLAAFAPRPVLLIHGEVDDVLPLRHHEALVDAAEGPKEVWVVEGMSHESPADYDHDEYERRLIDFLNRYLLLRSQE